MTIKTLRTERGMSLQDVATAANMSKAHVWELERGRSDNPSVLVLCALGKALDAPPMHLFEAAMPEAF